MSSLTPLKIIGKEFLYKNEEWYIINFNPFITVNSLDTLNDSTKNFNANVNAYIFDTTNFNEPTREQFKSFVTINDILNYLKPGSTSNLNNAMIFNMDNYLNIKSEWDDVLQNRNISLQFRPATGIIPKLNGLQEITIFNSYFMILEIPIVGTKKDYLDIPASTTPNAYILIPSSRCLNMNTLDQLQKDEYQALSEVQAKDTWLVNLLSTDPFKGIDVVLEETVTIVDNKPVLTLVDSTTKPMTFVEPSISLLDSSDIIQDDFGSTNIVTYTFNETTNDLDNKYVGSGYTVLASDSTDPDAIDKTGVLNIFGDGSCLACYKFDGNVTDLSGSNNGTATAITYGSGYIDSDNGGQAAIFNGTNSYVQLTSKASTLWYSGNRTVSMWFKSDAPIIGGPALVSRGATGESIATNENNIVINYSNETGTQFYVFRETGSSGTNYQYYSQVITNLNLGDGNWYNLVFVYTSTTIDIYVNGKIVGNITGMVVADTTAPNLYIGRYSSGVGYLKGQLDQVRFFNRKLTYQEIQVLYTEKIKPTPTFIDGKFRKAMVCNDKSYFESPLYIDSNLKQLTIGTWFKRLGQPINGYSSNNETTMILSFENPSDSGVLNDGCLRLWYTSNTIILELRSSYSSKTRRYMLSCTTDINIDDNNHFAITFNGSTNINDTQLYINGNKQILTRQIYSGESGFVGFDKKLWFMPGRSISYDAAWRNVPNIALEQFRMFYKVLDQDEILTCMYEAKPDLTTTPIETPEVQTITKKISTVNIANPASNQTYLERDYDNFANSNQLVFETLSDVLPSTGTYQAFIYEGYVYISQGVTGTSSLTSQAQAAESSNIYQAKINTDGTLGAFTKIANSPRPTPQWCYNQIQYDNKIFFIGGQNANYTGNTLVNTYAIAAIYVMIIDKKSDLANGAVPTVRFEWLGNLPSAIYGGNTWIHHNKLYIMGGANVAATTTYPTTGYCTEIYCEQESNGKENITLGQWSLITNQPARYASICIQTKSRVYILGGHNGTSYLTSIIYSEYPKVLDQNGNVNYDSTNTEHIPLTWQNDTNVLPSTISWTFNTFVTDKFAYIFGGYNGTSYYSNIWVAPIDANGILGAFTILNSSYSYLAFAGIIATDKYLYMLGGRNNGTNSPWTTTNQIRRAPLPALKDTNIISTGTEYKFYPEKQVTKLKEITIPKNEIRLIEKVDVFDDNSCILFYAMDGDIYDGNVLWNLTASGTSEFYPGKPGSLVSRYLKKSGSSFLSHSTFIPNIAGFNISMAIKFISLPFGEVYPDVNMGIWSFGTVSVLNGFTLIITTNTGLHIHTRGITSGITKIDAPTKPTFEINKWYNISTNITPSKIEIYVNGEWYCTYKYEQTKLSLPPAGIVFGKEIYTNSYFLDAHIDNIRYFNKVLTTEKIEILNKETMIKPTYLNEPDLVNIQISNQKLPYSGYGTFINTGKKLYRYDGVITDSTSNDYTADNVICSCDILKDGSLGDWKAENYPNPLGYRPANTSLCIFNNYVYIFGGENYTVAAGWTNYNNIKRAKINFDGSIGIWENIDSLRYYLRGTVVTQNKKDPSIIYVSGGFGGTTSTGTTYYSTMYTYKLNTNGTVTLLSSQTIPNCYGMYFIHLTDKNGVDYLYQMGEYQYSPRISNSDIYRITLVNNIPDVTTRTKVGTCNINTSQRPTIVTETDIYLFGGGDKLSATSLGGYLNIEKLNINSLVNATNQTQVVVTLLDTKLPYSTSLGIIDAGSQWLLYGRKMNEYGVGTYSWIDTTDLISIPKKEVSTSTSIIEKVSFKPAKIQAKTSNLLKGKLFNRYREEYLTRLFKRETQTLSNLNESIKFKDPVTNDIIEISESYNPVAISRVEAIFLEWLVQLTKVTNLTDYNNYVYSNLKGLNTNRLFDLIIPEIIFTLICDRKMFNINKLVLENYLVTNPLSQALLDKLLENGLEVSDFDIAKILETFFRFKVGVDSRTPIVFDANGPVYPKYNKIEFGLTPKEFNYIFIPQTASQRLSLSPRPIHANYFNSNCDYNLKIPEVDLNTKSYDLSMISGFYFVGVDGLNTNDGLSPDLPKKDLSTIPAGSNVYLLPGNYTGYDTISDIGGGTPLRKPKVFNGFNNHNIYGFGDTTIVNVEAPGGADGRCILYRPHGGSIHNMKFLFTGRTFSSDSYIYQASYVTSPNMVLNEVSVGYFYNCNFINTGYYNPCGKSSGRNPAAYLYNCTITGGIYDSSYYGNAWYTSSPARTSIDEDILTGKFNPTNLTNKSLIDNFNSSYEITPCYTLLPIADDEETFNKDNTIELEINKNITNIPNMNYKL